MTGGAGALVREGEGSGHDGAMLSCWASPCKREGRSECTQARPGMAQAGCGMGQKKERGEIEPMSLFLFRICFSISQK
jgi:hypothetical protein